MDQEKIGLFIRKLRLKNNFTQKDFANKLGVTYQAVSKWETGRSIPDIAILKQISKDFNINITDLLNGEKSFKKNKLILVFIIGLTILGAFFYSYNKDSYQFTTLATDCSNFEINGIVAYNKDKSSIYISNINYCGEESIIYKNIEAVLYEVAGNKEVIIEKNKESFKQGKTLEESLETLQFNVDKYFVSCRDFKRAQIYLQILATDFFNKTFTYKIPLKLLSKCDSTNG